MADKKISQLTGATTPVAGSEVLPIVQGGSTVKVSIDNLTAGKNVSAASVNKVAITAPATSATLTIADGKTLRADNTLTFAGTDSTTMTFPTTSATIARTDAAQSFTGAQRVLTSLAVGPDAKQTNAGLESNVPTSFFGVIGNTGFGTGGTPINPSTNYGFHVGYNRSNGNGESNLIWGSGIGASSDLVVGQWTGSAYSVHSTFKKSGSIAIATAGQGIDFSANTGAAGETSALLNWYEEGTWTPVIRGSSTAGTYELDADTRAYYTRIGRQVSLIVRIRLAAAVTGGGTGNLQITGVPFSKGAKQIAVGSTYLALGTFTGNPPTVTFDSFDASSILYLQQDASGGYGTSIPISFASANAYIGFTLTYFV